MDDTPTGNEAEAFLRARVRSQRGGTRFQPLVGPQWNVGILQRDENAELFAAMWKTRPDGACDLMELAPVSSELVITAQNAEGKAELGVGWQVQVLHTLEAAGDSAIHTVSSITEDDGWIVLAVFTLTTNTILPFLDEQARARLYTF
jgi:hypothetical protein